MTIRRTLLLLCAAVSAVHAQRPAVETMATIGGPLEESMRRATLLADSTVGLGRFTLLRSVSSMNRTNDTGAARRLQWAVLLPELRVTNNGRLPFSLNDGALWAGRGTSASAIAGVRVGMGPFRLILAPEFTYAVNDSFAAPAAPYNPVPPPPRSPFSSPWHDNGQSIDLPWRFGSGPVKRLTPGQSSLTADWRGVTFGAATENEWWGPGLRNGLILSNNAQGFEHLFVRPAKPAHTRFGDFDGRWIVGALRESKYFDSNPFNNNRSISMLAVTWTPPNTSLFTLGAARAVFAPAANRRDAIKDAFNVFADVGHPDAKPYLDSTITPGRDQLFSLFMRLVAPGDGFEAWAEWARTEVPRSLREFLLYPNHTQGYTLGAQWIGDPIFDAGRVRAQAEFTYLAQSTTFRFLPIGSWYTSRAVIQGYTNGGQSLGAAIGPGSSSQFVALDWLSPFWRVGGYFTRMQWLEDAHSQQAYPDSPGGTYGWCEHDVSMGPGYRAAVSTPFGHVTADYSNLMRMNLFFENTGPCPIGRGHDVRNKSLTVTITPRWK